MAYGLRRTHYTSSCNIMKQLFACRLSKYCFKSATITPPTFLAQKEIAPITPLCIHCRQLWSFCVFLVECNMFLLNQKCTDGKTCVTIIRGNEWNASAQWHRWWVDTLYNKQGFSVHGGFCRYGSLSSVMPFLLSKHPVCQRHSASRSHSEAYSHLPAAVQTQRAAAEG